RSLVFPTTKEELLMSRSNYFRFVAAALVLFFGFTLLGVDSRGNGKGEPKKVGQEQIVHGCISKITLASGSTQGTVTFEHPKWGGTGKVVEGQKTGNTDIQVCGETKTLADLKKLVDAVKTGQAKFCGIARIDNRTSLTASKIIVCNDADDD